MGKQLLILLSLLAGGSPARSQDNLPSEELICACFECMTALFYCLGQAERRIFYETGAKTIVDQNVYLLLEAITENPAEDVQFSAANTLQTLLSQISSRIVLASLLPRTVSALTKALKSTTQTRRTHKVFVAFLELLSHMLQVVLADEVAIPETTSQKRVDEVARELTDTAEESTILDGKWLKATASQVKLALANVVKLRNHGRKEVQKALFNMCSMICEKCSKTLSDSLQLIIDTMVMLVSVDEASPTRQRQILAHLVLSDAVFADLMRNSFDAWINALPQLMQGNDDRPKRQVLRHISAAYQILLECGDVSDLLDDSLATSLVQSISTAIDVSQARSLRKVSEAPSSTQMIHFEEQAQLDSFEPVILGQNSQLDSQAELHALMGQIRGSTASEPLTRSIMARIGQSSGSQQLSALWLSLNFLKKDKPSFSISEFIDIPDESFDTSPYLISDLYSITLPLLLDSSMNSAVRDWRVLALALESTVLQATQLGKSYRPELIDTLYPILSLLGSSEARLQSHAMAALNLLTAACEYPSTTTMLVENVDYLINSIALKLNIFDLSPQGPQILLMLLRLCGARLIPYLDDLIGSIFAALDNFHGYPRLVELLFEVLGVAVDEAAKNPALTITNGMEEPKHRKTAYQPSTMEDILKDIQAHKQRKEKRNAEILKEKFDDNALQSAPHRPWTSKLDGPQSPELDDEIQTSDIDNNDDETSPPHAEHEEQQQKEPPLSKPHILLLSIARSTVPHLSSPSPRVRLTLLQLLTRITPILSRHENSFLPLVNDIWPAILPRLFSLENNSSNNTNKRNAYYVREDEEGAEQPEDPSYITTAAASAISALCIGAGDFMSGRIEDIFPDLERIYIKIWDVVQQDRARIAQHRGFPIKSLADDMVSVSAGANLRGAVDLRIVDSTSGTNVLHPPSSSSSFYSNIKMSTTSSAVFSPPPPPTTLQSVPQPRTSTTQIHLSLINLLTTIIKYVHITPEMGDSILTLMGPVMDESGGEGVRVREALEGWNAEAVWVYRERRKKGVGER